MGSIVFDSIILFSLGIIGWLILSSLRFPAPHVLGPMILIGFLRISEVISLPPTPAYIYVVSQVAVGHFAGAKITRKVVSEMKTMILPALIIIVWALSFVFVVGWFLYSVTSLDLYTAILSCSMGGLSEMMLIALAIEADVITVIVLQTFRMVSTIFLFPFIITLWAKKKLGTASSEGKEEVEEGASSSPSNPNHFGVRIWGELKELVHSDVLMLRKNHKGIFISLIVASIGGMVFLHLGVPAGAMVGGMFAVTVLSLARLPVKPLPNGVFDVIQIGIGVMIADKFSRETMEVLTSREILLPLLLVTLLAILTSFAVSWIIYKITKWDYPTCFLAAAPGGFMIMTLLAVKYNQDPVRVSLLHLCRLLTLKSVMPLVFMFWA